MASNLDIAARLRRWFAGWRERRHEARVLNQCGCICRCPGCSEILNDQAIVQEEGGLVNYFCQRCGWWSKWDFDSCPVPVLRSGGNGR